MMHVERVVRREQSGFVLVVVAILLIVLVAFVALGVEVGVLYSHRTSSQSIADSAALAGAFSFVSSPTAPQPATAIQRATAIAVSNSIMHRPVTGGEVTVSVDIPNRRVMVDLQTSQPTFFARALSLSNASIVTRGVAEAGSGADTAVCPKPWYIPNTTMSGDPACTACAAGQVLIDPSTGQVTAYARALLGQQIMLKPQQPNQALAPSQFFAIDVGGSGGGANEYRDAIGACTTPPVACGDLLDVKTGNMVGPTRQGVDALIGDPPDDLYQAVGEYLINGNQPPSDVSKALIVAPIWDTCNFPGFCPGERFPSGTWVNVPVIGFAMVFVEGFQSAGNQAPVVGRFINVAGCAPAVSGPRGSTVFSFPLRLVRMP